MSIAGTLSAATFSSALDVEEGWGGSPSGLPAETPTKSPLVYWYGRTKVEDNMPLYEKLVARLAIAVNARLETSKGCKW